jgi:glycine/D-amino acid oxidase-like deaminating enzyme
VTQTRRDFLAMLLGAPAAASWACRAPRHPALPPGELIATGAELGHRWIRDARALPAATPGPWQRHRVVIIGGGVAGLAAAWALRRRGVHDVVVLELDAQLGGTARGGASPVSAYPWGAHYIVAPTAPQVELTALLAELGGVEGYTDAGEPIVDEALRCRDPEERLFYLGRWYSGLYLQAGASADDLRQLAAFQREIARWAGWRDDAGAPAFAIPMSRCSAAPELRALDRRSFASWLDEHGLTSPRLRWLCDYACRDDYGLTASSASAWAGLFYFAARQGAGRREAQPVITWPEGNAALVRHLASAAAVRLSAAVTSVESTAEGVRVLAHGDAGPIALLAERAVVAVPRFVARHLVSALRDEASGPGDYGAWAVANLHLRRRPRELPGAPASWDSVLYHSKSLGYVTATHQRGRDVGPTVLTWYYPFVDEDATAARRSLVGAGQPEWAELALTDLERAHPDLRSITERIDIAFWGHGMIRPKVGAIWHPTRPTLAAPRERLHFAHTDLSGLALFEEAFDHGTRAAGEVAAALGWPA